MYDMRHEQLQDENNILSTNLLKELEIDTDRKNKKPKITTRHNIHSQWSLDGNSNSFKIGLKEYEKHVKAQMIKHNHNQI
jgi:hypothetical protein